MKRYFIEDAKCGVGEGGFACGPVSGPVIAMVKFTVDGETKFIVNEEFEGIPNFYYIEKDLFDELISDSIDEDERAEMITGDCKVTELDGINLDGEYDEVIESLLDNEDSPAAPFVRYILALTRCDYDEIDEIVALAKGKFADEIDIPISDVEEEICGEI